LSSSFSNSLAFFQATELKGEEDEKNIQQFFEAMDAAAVEAQITIKI